MPEIRIKKETNEEPKRWKGLESAAMQKIVFHPRKMISALRNASGP